MPRGFLRNCVVLDQSGIHLADEVLHGDGRHFGTAQFDRSQQLGTDKVILQVLQDEKTDREPGGKPGDLSQCP